MVADLVLSGSLGGFWSLAAAEIKSWSGEDE